MGAMGSGIASFFDGDVGLFLCGSGEIGAGSGVVLVCVGRLWRIGGWPLLLPVRRSVGVGFIGKGELYAWGFRTVAWGPGGLRGMGGEWVRMGGNYTKGACPVRLVHGYG